MPPRYAYWTIILDDAPTSFRTKEREEILPLFNQLRAKNPAAMLKWFSGGRLWDSPEQAKEVRDVEKVRRFREARAHDTKEQRELEAREMAAFREKHGRPADGSDQRFPSPGPSAPREGRPPSDRRGKDWRPGGDHRDPRDKYKLPPGESRKRWKDRNLRPRGPQPFGSKPESDRPFGDRPRSPKPFGGKPSAPSGPQRFGERDFRRGGASFDSRQNKFAQDRPAPPKGGRKPYGDRPLGEPSTSLRPGRPRGPKPFGSKPGGPAKFGGKPGASPRPFGKKPFGGPRRKG